ncbi:replication terminator protein [Peribacillus frigoritolerans]|uniref:replication terminator protein n=1 Tax=Peribacillus frigoritolerans TaxID=450367 RepID=UPI003D014D2D
MEHNIDLSTFADGALAERVNLDLQKLFENIADPNTDAKKTRKLTLTLTLKADDKRDIVSTSITSKLAVAPARDLETKIVIGHNGSSVIGQELKSGIPGQSFITDHGEIATDTGEIIDDTKTSSNVVNFK